MTRRIALVLFDDFQQLDVAGPLAAFEIAERARPGAYRWRCVASRAGSVRSSAGLGWSVEALPRRGQVDLLLVSGGDGVDEACDDPALRRWLLRQAAPGPGRCERIASVCSGSLLLAAAGLLDGRAATTHWVRTQQALARHPQVRWQPDRIFVRDGRLWTSAGISAGIDLALALIAADHGEKLARLVARHLVLPQRRTGGQSQFSALLEMQRPEGRFTPLLEHVRSHLAERHAVQDLAERVHMSPRHFARAFAAETGATPARAVEKLRVEAARAALEAGAASVQQVVRDCGFGQGERMRRAFLRQLGQPPAALKRRAARASA